MQGFCEKYLYENFDDDQTNGFSNINHLKRTICRSEMGEILFTCMEEQDTFLNEDGDVRKNKINA